MFKIFGGDFILSSILRHAKKQISEKKIKNFIPKIRDYKSADYNKKNEVKVVKFKFLSDKSTMSKLLWKNADSSEPTDVFIIHSEEERIKLLERCKIVSSKRFCIPADIFLNKTIPLYDFILKYEKIEFTQKFSDLFYRIIFDIEHSMIIAVVNFEFNLKQIQLATFFYFFKKSNELTPSFSIIYRGINENKLNKIPEDVFNFLFDSFQSVMIDWYSIQYALLNPVVKEQIKNRKNKIENSSETAEYKYRKNNKVTYIKRVPITVDDLIVGEKRKYEIHADKWGVLGHWRTYKNGKKSWIKPYEKGPKRGKKLENQEIRERVIVTEQKN